MPSLGIARDINMRPRREGENMKNEKTKRGDVGECKKVKVY